MPKLFYKHKRRGGGGAAPAGAANFRKDIEAGFDLTTLLEMVTDIEAGVAIDQTPATLMREQEAGLAVETFASGTCDHAQDAGFAADTVMTMINLPDNTNGIAQQQYIEYVGTKWITTATNIGADNFTNVTNAQGANDGTSATRAGQTLSSTDGQIRGQFTINAGGEKDPLNIDKVELRFHVSQTGTALNNGGLGLDWRIGSSGGWTNLATYTNNQNFISTPDTYDITGSIASWANIRDIEIRVTATLGTATALVTVSADAVRLHVEGSLIE